MKFSRKLKILREEKGFSREKLARELGISAGTIFCWETNKHTPSFKNLTKLSQVLETPVSELIEDTPTQEE